MTTYYWMIAKEGQETALANVFEGAGKKGRYACWCAADANGKPVLFNHATTTPDAGAVAGKATLVGHAEMTKVLVDPKGVVQTAGYEYCRAQGIRATASDIYAHAQENMFPSVPPAKGLNATQ